MGEKLNLKWSVKLVGISIPKYVILFWAHKKGKFFFFATEPGGSVILRTFRFGMVIFKFDSN